MLLSVCVVRLSDSSLFALREAVQLPESPASKSSGASSRASRSPRGVGFKGDFRQWRICCGSETDCGFPRQPLQPSRSDTLALEIGGENVTLPSDSSKQPVSNPSAYFYAFDLLNQGGEALAASLSAAFSATACGSRTERWGATQDVRDVFPYGPIMDPPRDAQRRTIFA